ncbi:SMI1/KNR4 family protein [Streptomyces sp. PmtG]
MTETAGAAHDWRGFLTRWSGEWADACDPDEVRDEGDEEALRTRWLGFAPATTARVTALEERVGRPLPPSYRSFLDVTDGWRHAGGFVWRLAGAEHARWQEDENGLTEMFLEHLDEDATPEQIQEATVWARGLRLDVETDAVSIALDPRDVDEHGEWAVLTWAPWRASPPERYASFWEFMRDMYRQFHHLGASRDEGRFVNATTQALDAAVEEARRDALRGDYERAERAIAEAESFGRPRASALRDQIRRLLGDFGHGDFRGLATDPVYAAELLPVLAARHVAHRRHDSGWKVETPTPREDVRTAADEALRQARQASFRYDPGGAFGAAVDAARERARWGEADAAWRTLLEALPEWRPLGPHHLASRRPVRRRGPRPAAHAGAGPGAARHPQGRGGGRRPPRGRRP